MPAPTEEDSIVVEGKRIAYDDFIKVLPTPGKRNGYMARVRAWWVTEEGVITGIDVWGGHGDRVPMMRTLRLDRLEILSTRKQNELRRVEEARAAAKRGEEA